MSAPNRVRLYYPYLCTRCCKQSLRGSSAKTCDLVPPLCAKPCGGALRRLPGKARTKLLLAK